MHIQYYNYLNTSNTILFSLVADKSNKDYLNQGRQEDAEEFLTALIDVLEKELKHITKFETMFNKIHGMEKKERKFMDNPIGWCVKCKSYPRVSEERFLTLQLAVPSCAQVQLESLLNSYFYEDEMTLSCSNGCCQCEGKCRHRGVCNHPVETFTSLSHSPDFLMIQLKRFAYDTTGTKVTDLNILYLFYYQL